jgi:hypothetical protein
MFIVLDPRRGSLVCGHVILVVVVVVVVVIWTYFDLLLQFSTDLHETWYVDTTGQCAHRNTALFWKFNLVKKL